ncbi:hypothetical protein DPMN_034681 [Dreissena polymorpha]|uniref:DUF5641 domain-containing protein n=1 Tax=Dreissena polymorpha TaxID=45954 RepID=A0A9D4M7A3_DREPO|nr:hypothetical protein DPMN_034681 [Dreissena polymorpha]
MGFQDINYSDSDPDYKDVYTNADKLLQMWKKGQNLINAFGNIWKNQYLQSLRERFTSQMKSPRVQAHHSPSVGDVVIVKDDLPRGQWNN